MDAGVTCLCVSREPAGDLGAVRPPTRAGPCERLRVKQHGLCSLHFSVDDVPVNCLLPTTVPFRKPGPSSQGTCTCVMTLQHLGGWCFCLVSCRASGAQAAPRGGSSGGVGGGGAHERTKGARGRRRSDGAHQSMPVQTPAHRCAHLRGACCAKGETGGAAKTQPLPSDQIGIKEKLPHRPRPHAWLDDPFVNYEGLS
jgi:hypothetical protein